MGLIYHHFTEGKAYSIGTKRATQHKPLEFLTAPLSNPDYGYVFIYIGKQGKHHVFREKNSGWTRTYTDQQLMGKQTEEIEQ